MSTPSKDIIAAYGLTPRDVDIAIKALITMVDGNLKPDYDKLAKLAGFKDGVAANKGWWATRKKLLAAKGAGGGGDDDAASAPAPAPAHPETPKRKRKNTSDAASNTPASKTPKRGRGGGRAKKNAEPAAEAVDSQAGVGFSDEEV